MKGYKGLDLPKGQQWGVWMIWTLFPLEHNLISQTYLTYPNQAMIISLT